MNKILITLCLLCLFQRQSKAQIQDTEMLKRTWNDKDTGCNSYYENLAKRDIHQQVPTLIVMGSTVNTDFEGEFGVKYTLLGCSLHDRVECLTSYNKVIFNYLDSKFGRKWRRTVNPNVFGLKRGFFHHRRY